MVIENLQFYSKRHYLFAFAPAMTLNSSSSRWSRASSSTENKSRRYTPKSQFHVGSSKVGANVVSAQWLSEQLDSAYGDEMIILDVRGRVLKPGGRVPHGYQSTKYVADDEAFFAGHIPGASFIDWRNIDLAQHEELCDTLARAGVDRQKPLCLYDWGDMLFATRMWFALSAMGCSNTMLINGGWSAWDKLNGRVALETKCPLEIYSDFETELEPRQVPTATIGMKDLRKIVTGKERGEGKDTTIIDARSKKQFAGAERRGRRAGHIPGAINVPYRSLLKENSIGLRTKEDVEEVLSNAGLETGGKCESKYIVYCNGGVSSTLVIFALVMCGVPFQNIRNYCGSFNEWGNVDDTPLERD